MIPPGAYRARRDLSVSESDNLLGLIGCDSERNDCNYAGTIAIEPERLQLCQNGLYKQNGRCYS